MKEILDELGFENSPDTKVDFKAQITFIKTLTHCLLTKFSHCQLESNPRIFNYYI